MAAKKSRVIIDSVKLTRKLKDTLSLSDLDVAIKLRDTKYLKSPNNSPIIRMAAARRDKAAKLMAGYYTGTLKAIQSVLDNPGTGVWITPVERRFYRRVPIAVGYHGSKMPQTEEVRLESGVTTFSKWEGLSPGYASSQGKWSGLPPSRNIWRKTGKLRDSYNAWLATESSRLSNIENYRVSLGDFEIDNYKAMGAQKNPSQGYRPFPYPGQKKVFGYAPNSKRTLIGTVTFSLKHPSLRNPVLDAIIGEAYRKSIASSFVYSAPKGADEEAIKAAADTRKKLVRDVPINVTYKTGKLAGRTFTRQQPVISDGLSRMGLAEARRPMISRFAAAAGAREAAALRKLLQRK